MSRASYGPQPMSVEIRHTPIGGNLRDFLDVVATIYKDNPNYVRSLDMEVKDRLSRKNPFFDENEGTVLTAYQGGKCVGRCTAQTDKSYLARYKDDCGFFGFIDTIDDAEVAKALLDEAGGWLVKKGMKRMLGPVCPSLNDELGCLVEGFDTPPFFMMPYHQPYQAGLIEKAGLAKCKDLFAWRYHTGKLPERAIRAHAMVKNMPEIKLRSVDLKHVQRDIGIVVDVYNDAWGDNWGFVPLSERELAKLADSLRFVLLPELTQIIELNGEPVAVTLVLPNLNEMLSDLNGRLLPTGILKLLWRLKVRGPRSARVIILGIRRKLRYVRKYGALSTFMYVELHRAAEKLHIFDGELSWTLEENAAVNLGIQFMGGKHYKTYRLFDKQI